MHISNMCSLRSFLLPSFAVISYAREISNTSAFIVSTTGSSVVFANSQSHRKTTRNTSTHVNGDYRVLMTDSEYPGTAVERMMNVRERLASVSQAELNGRWEDVRRKLLWAGGLKDLVDAAPGMGYTGHSFNDFNHVDLTCMLDQVSDNENDGSVKGIALGNRLGNGIRLASLPELGPGGSWTTCAMGCNKDPPQDVAHIQFRARIAFKLVWVPENYDSFVLVDDEGRLLAHGKPSVSEGLPPLRERQLNYRLVAGSKYAREADRIARNVANE